MPSRAGMQLLREWYGCSRRLTGCVRAQGVWSKGRVAPAARLCPCLTSADPARLADQAALAPVVVLEQLWAGQQHPGVVRPGDERVVAALLGLLDELAQAPLRVGPEVGADAVGGVDVEAVQREAPRRAGRVHGELEE